MSLVALTVSLAGIWFMFGDRSTVNVNINTSMGPGWFISESRDEEGRLMFPPDVVERTAKIRWADRKEGLDPVSLFTGYYPGPVLGLWNKMYHVERVFYGDDDAWRRSAKITIHLPLSRKYESEWFKNIGDKTLRIFSSEESEKKPGQVLRIEKVQFFRKEISIFADGKLSEKQRMFGVTIEARESILTALYNTTLGTMTKSKVITFLGSLMAAVLAGLFVWWLQRRDREDAS